MEQVFLALGSNIGNRAEYLRKAVVLLTQKVGEVVEKSEVIETEAVGFDAPPFLNQVLAVRTTLSPMELLQVTQEIEKTLGRDHKTHYQDGVPIYHNRTIDIDILEYGNLRYQSEQLEIPHPRIYEREFVWKPLLEVKEKLKK